MKNLVSQKYDPVDREVACIEGEFWYPRPPVSALLFPLGFHQHAHSITKKGSMHLTQPKLERGKTFKKQFVNVVP